MPDTTPIEEDRRLLEAACCEDEAREAEYAGKDAEAAALRITAHALRCGIDAYLDRESVVIPTTYFDDKGRLEGADILFLFVDDRCLLQKRYYGAGRHLGTDTLLSVPQAEATTLAAVWLGAYRAGQASAWEEETD